jgi:ribosomal subunit interface protein
MALLITHGAIRLTPALRTLAERKAEKLMRVTKMFGNGAVIRMEFGRVTAHHRKGKIFRAEINCDIPGIKVGALRAEATHWDLRTAVDRATDEMARQLEKFRGRLAAQYKKGAREFKRRIREG